MFFHTKPLILDLTDSQIMTKSLNKNFALYQLMTLGLVFELPVNLLIGESR
jgi:hypothetical protein